LHREGVQNTNIQSKFINKTTYFCLVLLYANT